MLVFQNKFKRVLDAATVDRCDFVEICCSDVPCLTRSHANDVGSLLSYCCALMVSEITMQRHVRRFLVGFPRNDLRRLGYHLQLLLIRTNSTRCSLRSRLIFRQFFGYAAAVLSNGGHIHWECLAKCIGWSNVELREFRAQQKSCGRGFFMTANDSCFFAKRENNLLEGSSLAECHIRSSIRRVHE